MELPNALSKKPARIAAVLAVPVVVGIALLVMQVRGASNPVAAERAFFTIDDGKTWFPDDASKIPPFTKDGKDAVRAYVYRSDKGVEFVNYLARFKPDAKQALEAADKPEPSAKRPSPGDFQRAYSGREVKRPGDAAWASGSNYRDVGQVTAIKCPDGSANATPVEP